MTEAETNLAQDSGDLDEALLRAISHPLRHRLLGMLDGRTASPNQLARELDLPLGRVRYHIRLLAVLLATAPGRSPSSARSRCSPRSPGEARARISSAPSPRSGSAWRTGRAARAPSAAAS